MVKELNDIIVKETKALKDMLIMLDEQYEYVVKNDIFKMESVVGKIQNCSRNIAKFEMERRKLTNGESMSKLVIFYNDSELSENYRAIKKLLEEVLLQKEANEVLIRQGLGYANRMLKILNPDRSAKTYSGYGKMK